MNSDYFGIRGWTAKVVTLVPTYKENKLSAVVGELKFFPHRKDRSVRLDGIDFSLDVLFQCFREEVIDSFFKTVKVGEVLVITGDLSERSYSEYKPEITTNCWVDEFVIDKSRGQCSPIVGRLQSSDLSEFLATAKKRYGALCPHCEKEMVFVPYEMTKYCVDCDT